MYTTSYRRDPQTKFKLVRYLCGMEPEGTILYNTIFTVLSLVTASTGRQEVWEVVTASPGRKEVWEVALHDRAKISYYQIWYPEYTLSLMLTLRELRWTDCPCFSFAFAKKNKHDFEVYVSCLKTYIYFVNYSNYTIFHNILRNNIQHCLVIKILHTVFSTSLVLFSE